MIYYAIIACRNKIAYITNPSSVKNYDKNKNNKKNITGKKSDNKNQNANNNFKVECWLLSQNSKCAVTLNFGNRLHCNGGVITFASFKVNTNSVCL